MKPGFQFSINMKLKNIEIRLSGRRKKSVETSDLAAGRTKTYIINFLRGIRNYFTNPTIRHIGGLVLISLLAAGCGAGSIYDKSEDLYSTYEPVDPKLVNGIADSSHWAVYEVWINRNLFGGSDDGYDISTSTRVVLSPIYMDMESEIGIKNSETLDSWIKKLQEEAGDIYYFAKREISKDLTYQEAYQSYRYGFLYSKSECEGIFKSGSVEDTNFISAVTKMKDPAAVFIDGSPYYTFDSTVLVIPQTRRKLQISEGIAKLTGDFSDEITEDITPEEPETEVTEQEPEVPEEITENQDKTVPEEKAIHAELTKPNIQNDPPPNFSESKTDENTKTLNHFSGEQDWTLYNSTNSGLPNNKISCLAADKSGNIWIGTLGAGVVKYNGTDWTIYNSENYNFPDDHIESITIEESGDIWVGMNHGGTARFDGIKWHFYQKSNSSISDNWVTSIAADKNSIKWIATSMGSLCSFDGKKWTRYDSKNSGLKDNWITSVVIDENDNKWIGTGSSGLVKYNDIEWVYYNNDNSGLPNNKVSAIKIEGNGDKWIGTRLGGLAKFDGSSWTVYNTDNSELPDNWITSIAITGNGEKWIGTSKGGLALFNGNEWMIFNKKNSMLPTDWVTSLVTDINGQIWVGSWGGLVRIK